MAHPAYESTLAVHNPLVAAEWDRELNELTPEQVSYASGKKAHWVGVACGHRWESVISSRTAQGSGCPYCSGNRVLVGFNDLGAVAPLIAAELHPTKNGDLTSASITAYSNKKLWWQGAACGHEWQAQVNNRVNGAGCRECSYLARGAALKRLPAGKLSFAEAYPAIATEWHPKKNGGKRPEDYASHSMERIMWLCDQGHEWEARIGDRVSYLSGCRACGFSQGEKDLHAYLLSLGVQVDQGRKDLIAPYELDLYLPAQQLAIEYNGLYWHSEKSGKSSTYHQEKWAKCNALGIQLIQVWEDDWLNRPAVVQQMLRHKLGLNPVRVYARKTQVKPLSVVEARSFFAANHVQGYASGGTYLGLMSVEQEVVAALIARTMPGTNGQAVEIVRYATSVSVPGGFSKLLVALEARYPQAERLVTFSDHTVSDGGLYARLGFRADKELAPDYHYVVRGKREHKFNYRLKRFRDDPNLIWQDNLSERELAALNGLNRIWDAGKTRWVKDLA